MKARALAVTAVTTALLLGTAGCGFFVPTATNKQYAASDGVSVNVGDLKIRNVILITDSTGAGSLIGTIVNDTTNPQNITIELRGTTSVTATVASSTAVTEMGTNGSTVLFAGANLVAGTYEPVYFQYGGQDGVLATIPVLDGTDPLYAPFEPSKLTPTATPTPWNDLVTTAPTATPTP